MAIALIQKATPGVGPISTNPIVLSTSDFGSPCTSGHLIVVCFGSYSGSPSGVTVTSVADTLGTSYSLADNSGFGADGLNSWIYYGVLGSSGTNHITITLANTSVGIDYCWVQASEFSGQAVSPFDTDSHALSAGVVGTTATSAAITTAGAGLLVGAVTISSLTTVSAGTNFTLLADAGLNGGSEYWITPSAEVAFSGTMTFASTNWAISVASFLAAAAVPATQAWPAPVVSFL